MGWKSVINTGKMKTTIINHWIKIWFVKMVLLKKENKFLKIHLKKRENVNIESSRLPYRHSVAWKGTHLQNTSTTPKSNQNNGKTSPYKNKKSTPKQCMQLKGICHLISKTWSPSHPSDHERSMFEIFWAKFKFTQ